MQADTTSGPDASADDARSADIQLRLELKNREWKILRRLNREAEENCASAKPSEADRFARHFANVTERVTAARAAVRDLTKQKSAVAQTCAGFVDFDEAVGHFIETIKRGDRAAASDALDRLSVSPRFLEERLRPILDAAKTAGRLDLLFTLFANAAPRTLSRFSIVATAAVMGIEIERRREALALLEVAQRRSDTQPIRFGTMDMLSQLARLDQELAERLSLLKYNGIRMKTESDIFLAAKALADRIDLDPLLLDFLFEHRRSRSLPREAWEERIRIAFCVGQLIWDRPRSASPAGRVLRYGNLVSEADRKEAFAGIDRTNGVLLATVHGGTTPLNRVLFQEEFEEHVIVANSTTASTQISVKNNLDGGLFQTLRAMSRGKSVLIAPDGAHGTRNYFGEVLGRSIRTAAGAAFLAYESRCYCAWYYTVPTGDRFLPVVVTAPKPDKQESFESFAERWLSFYWAEFENLLTGDPDGICLIGRYWAVLSYWDR